MIKKVFFITTMMVFTLSLLAQDLGKIVDNYEKAAGVDKLSQLTSVSITGTISQMGAQMPLRMLEKGSDKFKIVTSYNGMDIVQVVNGDRGYMVNPMVGSSEPINLNAEQIDQIKSNGILRSPLRDLMDKGNLALDGEETFNGKSCFRLKSTVEGNTAYFIIDKSSNLIVGQRLLVNQMGTEVQIEMVMSDFRETEGVMIPRIIETTMGGQSIGTITYDSVEFNVPIEDSEFAVK